jgi:DNA-binding HxlR family transcriptional regulator
MLILRDAGYGATRFDQFRQSLGIAPNILTRRLAGLTEAGLLEKRRYNERPPRDEYVLTPKGRDFLPVLAVIGAWGAQHCGERGTTRTIDVETGAIIDPVVVDRATGRPVAEINTRALLPDWARAH